MAKQGKNDSINPQHYKSHPSGVEAIEILEHMPYNIGSAMKYLWRCGLKQSAEDDEELAKAAWFIARERELRAKQKDKNRS